MPRQTVQPIRTAQVSGAMIKIKKVRNDALRENVVIVNQGTLPQPLSGWALASLRGERLFFFPDDLILLPGKPLSVHSGQGASGMANALNTNLSWTDEQVWVNRSDVAVLFDAHGEEVDRYAYPHTRTHGSATRRRELLVQDGERWRIEDEPLPEGQTVWRKDRRPSRWG